MNEIPVQLTEENILSVIGNVTSPFVVLSELIKNGIDANANSVTVNINSVKNTIKIIDNGDGFTIEDIQFLGNAAMSNKKKNGYIYNAQGHMLLGSKGLAFFSVFSLGEKVTIKTKNKNGQSFYIEWNKLSSHISYIDVPNSDYTEGSEIEISGIDSNDILLLTSEKELAKFKHISFVHFQSKENIPKVIIVLDNKKFNLDIENINSFASDFDSIVTFEYDSHKNTLKYKYETYDTRINNKEVLLDLNQPLDINKFLKENYNIKYEPLAFKDYLTSGLIERKDIHLPSFKGKWYVKTNKKNSKMVAFESGIRLYVNNFAMYNYLNRSYDWLDLTNISQVKKSNSFKQNNVFGFVNFENFNDNESGLKISNERGGFIEEIHYRKFIDLLYASVLYISINIDIACRNNKFYDIPVVSTSPSPPANLNLPNPDLPDISTNELDSHLLDSPTDEPSSNPMNSPTNEPSSNPTDSPTDEPSSHLLDSPTDEPDSNLPDSLTDEHGSSSGIFEELELKINMKNKSENLFFKTSDILKSNIDLEHNTLISQLLTLKYENHYLLFNLSFRVILEDTIKKYLMFRKLPLKGSMGENVASAIDDMISYTNQLSKQVDKDNVWNTLGGRQGFKSHLTHIKTDFYNNGKQEWILDKLNSLTHNPTWIPKNEAEHIANNRILPLIAVTDILMSYT